MKYLLEGDFETLKKIIRENRIRVARGLVTITALDDEVVDTKEPIIIDSKEPKIVADEKTTRKPKGKK